MKKAKILFANKQFTSLYCDEVSTVFGRFQDEFKRHICRFEILKALKKLS